MRKYLRYLRNCQDASGAFGRRHRTQAEGDGRDPLSPDLGDGSRSVPSSRPKDRRQSFVNSAVGPILSSRVYREDWIECLVQLHRCIAMWIAHDPRAVHDVVERLVRVSVDPQWHRRSHQIAKIASKTGVEIRRFVLAMNASPMRQVMRYYDRSSDELVGKLAAEPSDLGKVNRSGIRWAKLSVITRTDHLEVVHSVLRIGHRAID